MVTDDRFSDFVDPLENYSGLSLFPKTFEVIHASNSDDLDGQLQAIHNHLKSLALRSPDKLREQANKILDGNSKSLNTKTTSDLAPMGKNEALPALPKVNPRERRPALNRKRARFSLKPNSSHPAVSSEPALDLKKLKNPEEFFMAYERHENAKREILKQIGGNLSDSEQQNTSLIERPRRPGMLGHDKRRSIKYKHLYSCEDSETGKNVPSSQERNDSSILSPIYHSSQEETEQGFTSQETELVGSISKEDHKVDEILDQLLSYNCEDLDGDGVLNILQEHLQIKPVELEKLQLPDFQEIPKIDLKSSRSGKLPTRSRVLLDVENILKGLSSKTPTKHGPGAESPFSYGASPTPPKSPFASFLLVHQEILRSSLSNDRFSAHDIDQPVRSSSFIESINKEIDFADERRQSEETVFEKDDNVEVAVIDTSKQDGALNVGSSASHVPVDDNIMNNDMVNSVMNDRACERDANGDAQADRTNVEDKVQVEDAVQETLLPAQSGIEMLNLALDNSNKQSHLGLGAESPFSYGASPTPPKSPFASFLLLNQKNLRSSLSNDRFSAHDIDQPVRSFSFIESINKEIDFADERRQSEETIFEKDDNVEVAMTDTSKQDGALNVGSNASYVPVDGNIMNNDMDNSVMNDRACEHDANGDAQANRTNVEDKVQVEDAVQGTLLPAQSGLEMMDLALDNSNKQSHLDEPSTASIHDQEDRNPEIPDNDSEQDSEMEEEHPNMPLDKNHKATTQSQKSRKRRKSSQGKSLGGAGTHWESGVRRSTRIRCRPLEYWKGERLLYGRIHRTLPTVIGLKYASPGKGNGALTLKSYVSAEHQDLVELAGLH
ncbi:centromere protein C isoform X1 [Morus notabilis]|uniref:centromere protein C isoform X1 n=1 Tax=Morus notabilis TaxID=981085 RepID=UPI000CED6440|nr:centromere protein C isoform X1 [Morus notabilis]